MDFLRAFLFLLIASHQVWDKLSYGDSTFEQLFLLLWWHTDMINSYAGNLR